MTMILRVLVLLLSVTVAQAADPPIKVLFLGDQGPHRPADRFAHVANLMAARGIDLEYTEGVSRLNKDDLATFDVLSVYANIVELPSKAEGAILDFVRGGKGLVPLHCASSERWLKSAARGQELGRSKNASLGWVLSLRLRAGCSKDRWVRMPLRPAVAACGRP